MSQLSIILHACRAPIRLASRILVASILALPALAADMPSWSDKTVCRLVAGQADNAVYLVEAQRRELDCGTGSSGNGNKQQSAQKLLPKNQGIVIYPLKLNAQTQQRLLSKPIDRTEFNFSSYQLAVFSQPIACQFNLRRVVYEDHVAGQVENWNMATGRMILTDDGVKIEGRWRMGGLSKDSSYLKHEVNLRLTKAGHLVGKMAYFNLNLEEGEVPKKPLYIELKPHNRSQPLNINNPKKAEFWTDVEDWAGGVWRLRRCAELNS